MPRTWGRSLKKIKWRQCIELHVGSLIHITNIITADLKIAQVIVKSIMLESQQKIIELQSEVLGCRKKNDDASNISFKTSVIYYFMFLTNRMKHVADFNHHSFAAIFLLSPEKHVLDLVDVCIRMYLTAELTHYSFDMNCMSWMQNLLSCKLTFWMKYLIHHHFLSCSLGRLTVVLYSSAATLITF